MPFLSPRLLASLALSLTALVASAAGTYHVVALDALGGSSVAYGISSAGVVAGSYGANGGTHAFLYSNGAMSGLDDSAYLGSEAFGVNDAGRIAGYITADPYGMGAFDLAATSSAGMLGELMPAQPSGQAMAINAAGHIVGYANGAFLDVNGTMTDLGGLGSGDATAYALNDLDQVAGDATADSGYGARHAFRYANGAMEDLGTLATGSGYFMSSARAINDAGQVAGWSWTDTAYLGHAFLYSGGAMQDLGTLGGSYDSSSAFGLNDSGQVVGRSAAADNVDHAFLYAGGAMRDLNALLDASGAGWTLNGAYAINDRGQIVGYGTHDGVTRGFLLNANPVPEPAPLAALALGALAALRGRRRK